MKNARFMANNFLSTNFTYSSQKSTSFPASNIYNSSRSRVWKTGGNFEVTTSNQNLYINDGTDKTVVLTAGTYTYSTLATHIQTQLNASSTNWTCTYNSSTTFKFTIARSSGTAVLRQTVTTNAAWDMLGYTLGTDAAVTPFVADEQRNHTSEWVKCYFPVGQLPTFVALMSQIDEAFCLSDEAVVKLQANNLDLWTSPAVDVSVPVENLAAMAVLDTSVTTSYNYFRIVVIDRKNPLGPEELTFGYAYVGDHVTMTSTNIARGFSKRLVDPSIVSSSESGALFFEERPRYLEISGSEIQMLNGTDADEIEQLFYDLGVTTPFLLSIDPDETISRNLSDLTRLMIMTESPEFQHVIYDYYNVGFSMRESF